MQKLKWKLRNIIGFSKWQPDMFAKATGITCMRAGLGTRKTYGARQALERGMTGMTKARMPERAVVRCKESSRRARRGAGVMAKWVEFAGRITSEQSHPGAEILDREAPWIKFNRNGIVTG